MNAAPIKVLVIDDEPPIRKLLRMGLSTQGYEVLEASNGRIALEQLSQDPALIILDLGLPDIQGHDLLRMIRGRNDGVPIVVLSSRAEIERLHLAGFIAAARQHHDRHAVVAAADHPQQLMALDIRQTEIENDQRRILRHQFERVSAVGGFQDLVALRA